MNLFRRYQPRYVRPAVAQAGSKPVFEPAELFQSFGAVNLLIV